MAAVGRVLCCGWVEALVDSVTSLPPFSQSKGSFSVMIRSFMLFSNTDMSSWTETRGWTHEPRTGDRGRVGGGSLCGAYLVVWFGIVVQGQDVFQEDVELGRHVFEQHPVVVALLNLTDLFLEDSLQSPTGRSHNTQRLLSTETRRPTLSLIFLQGSCPTANSTNM